MTLKDIQLPNYNKTSLQWRHNGDDCVSNHQPHDCLLNRLFRRRSKNTSKRRVTGLCEGNSPVTDEFPAQWAGSAENVSIWWRHHENIRIIRGMLSIARVLNKPSTKFCDQILPFVSLGHLHKDWVTLLPTWISNRIHYNVWNEWNYLTIINFNSAAGGVWEWISNFIPHFAGHVITYPWWD